MSWWVKTLKKILDEGTPLSPRGKNTLDLPQHTVVMEMRRPVLINKARALSYKFMAAEAFWILSGDDTVTGITPWNARIAEFSDDGKTFFGAYGPKIAGQLDYVVRKLNEDPSSRQAGLTIWRENPPQTKDMPCTVAIFARIIGSELNLHVFMRSSDAWLGLPYDTFNFSMLACLICCRLNADRADPIEPGRLFLTAASSHLYEEHFEKARAIVADTVMVMPPPSIPRTLFLDKDALMTSLRVLRETVPGDSQRWWERAA